MLGMLTQLAIIQIFSCVVINYGIVHICEIVVLCKFWVLDYISLDTVVYHMWCGLHLFMYIHLLVLVSGHCCFCSPNLMDILVKLCDSCWVSVFKLLFIFIFNCVPLSNVLNGFLL